MDTCSLNCCCLSCPVVRFYWTLANQSKISFLHGHCKIHHPEKGQINKESCVTASPNICLLSSVSRPHHHVVRSASSKRCSRRGSSGWKNWKKMIPTCPCWPGLTPTWWKTLSSCLWEQASSCECTPTPTHINTAAAGWSSVKADQSQYVLHLSQSK